MKILSLYDGISCGRAALEQAGISVEEYAAFEIDKYAKSISRYNYPDIKHYGNVLDADFSVFQGYDMIIGGSPCTFWSIAKANREVDKDGAGWKLFMGFINALRQVKPHWFLYENVASMPQNIKAYITQELGVEPLLINSALVSAQQRKRLYWTNIPGITQPKDKGILLKDILENGINIANVSKAQTIPATIYKENAQSMLKRNKAGLLCAESVVCEPACLRYERTEYAKQIRKQYENKELGTKHRRDLKQLSPRPDGKTNTLTTVLKDNMICEPVRIGTYNKGGQGNRIYSVYGKTVCISASGGGAGAKTGLYKVDLPDGDYIIRKLTPREAERCQTLPDDYTAFGIDDAGKTVPVSNTQRYKCIGNGWTVDVIAHILEHLPLEGGG